MGYMKNQAIEDGGFAAFLQEAVDCGGLEGAALGITKLVIDKGKGALSPKQAHVFKAEVLDLYTVAECGRCSGEVPWCEMMEASDNGGFCGWCAHMSSKDD